MSLTSLTRRAGASRQVYGARPARARRRQRAHGYNESVPSPTPHVFGPCLFFFGFEARLCPLLLLGSGFLGKTTVPGLEFGNLAAFASTLLAVMFKDLEAAAEPKPKPEDNAAAVPFSSRSTFFFEPQKRNAKERRNRNCEGKGMLLSDSFWLRLSGRFASVSPQFRLGRRGREQRRQQLCRQHGGAGDQGGAILLGLAYLQRREEGRKREGEGEGATKVSDSSIPVRDTQQRK